MDRFVTRTPTWKTLNYSSMAAQSFASKGTLKKTPGDNKKKPLQQKQLSDLTTAQSYDFEKRIGDLLPSTQQPQQQQQQVTNVDNFNGNSNDSGLSSSSSISPQHFEDNLAGGFNAASPFKKLSTPSKKHLDCPLEKENDTYMTLKTRSPKSHKKLVETGGLQIQKTLETANKFTLQQQVQGTPERPLTSVNNMIMARIQRDLDSPSAAARMKALRALKSPTKSAYTQFDIPEAEQSLHLPEPPSLQEIMRNIVVYVEVRSGEDNRSAGVRKVIEALGARVNLGLNRDTTHVVFKDGLLSTFKKATQMNIPIVSILWIEACKNQRRICDPKDYPISNLDRYENPELYAKMKRVKSMQPDSECNKRIRVKTGGTPKDSTPTQKTGNLKKTSTLIGGTPTSSTNKKKTDISQFFKKLEGATPTSTAKLNGGDSNHIPESPATLLLNRINSECYTPLNELKKKAIDCKENEKEKPGETINDKVSNGTGGGGVGAKKSLDFLQVESSPKVTQENDIKITTSGNRRSSVLMQQNSVVEIEASVDFSSSVTIRRGKQRRHSSMASNELDTATSCLNTMTISVTTPTKSNRRRSSLHTPRDMSVITETPDKFNNIAPILEENNEMEQQQKEKPPKSVTKRRTLYNVKTMEQTELLSENTNKDLETPNKKSTRRRTLYNTKTMETSDINPELSHNSVKRRTCYSVKSLEQTEEETETKKTLSIDSTNMDEIKTSTTTTNKLETKTSRRKTVYGGETSTVSAVYSPNRIETSGVCLTPTNFQTGRVIASSTLLEDSGNRSHLIATPPADATTGKLLEETEQCVTPLIFSSTRQPGNKRRTLFDVSMDIITQRLQCINQSARRSLAPPTPSAEIINTDNITPVDNKNSNNLLQQTTPHSSSETLNECTNLNDGVTTKATTESNTLKKKRKLFMPNELLATPTPAPAKTTVSETPTEITDPSLTSNKTGNSNSVQKRRRTLMPISQPQLPTLVTLKDSSASATNVRKRRSTLDFEQIQNIKTKTQTKESSSTSSSTANQTKSKTKKSPVLVYTNMHQQQIEVIREAINQLGSFTLESNVTDITTHLVSLEPRRTLNLLKALTRGLWILDYNWIEESLKAGQWLAEEAYELRNFSKGVEISRSERQAFGNNYKCDLFHKFGAFYVSSQCSPINKESMRELIVLCGGRVVNTRQKARYIIGDSNRTLEDKFYLTPFWILDSITQMQIQKVNKYMYPLPDGKSASQPLILEQNNH
ncbi:microcephalin isoform 2-T2 [Cochliomyia hominivorax]